MKYKLTGPHTRPDGEKLLSGAIIDGKSISPAEKRQLKNKLIPILEAEKDDDQEEQVQVAAVPPQEPETSSEEDETDEDLDEDEDTDEEPEDDSDEDDSDDEDDDEDSEEDVDLKELGKRDLLEMAEDLEIDVEELTGSGAGGKVLKKDLIRAIKAAQEE